MVEISLFARLNVHHPPSPLLPRSRLPRLRPKRQDKRNSLVTPQGAHIARSGSMFLTRFFHRTYKQSAAGPSSHTMRTDGQWDGRECRTTQPQGRPTTAVEVSTLPIRFAPTTPVTPFTTCPDNRFRLLDLRVGPYDVLTRGVKRPKNPRSAGQQVRRGRRRLGVPAADQPVEPLGLWQRLHIQFALHQIPAETVLA